MGRFVLRRLLIFVPTLLVILLVAFALSEATPGDPVEKLFQAAGGEFYGDVTPATIDRQYAPIARRHGLDRPAFYFSLTTAAYPDTLHRYYRTAQRRTLRQLLDRHGHWPLVEAYYRQLIRTERSSYAVPDSLARLPAVKALRRRLDQLKSSADPEALRDLVENSPDIPQAAPLEMEFDRLRQATRALTAARPGAAAYLPALHWHGSQNRFHRRLTGALTLDFGVSLRDGRPVGTHLREALGWTLLLSISALVLSFLIAVPLGVWSAARSRSDGQGLSFFLYALYSLPVFWVATLLLIFFTTPEYGMDWFYGQWPVARSDAGFWQRVGERIGFLVLPVFCLTYGRLAYIFMQVRGGMLDVLQRPYVRTARAKGLTERRVVWGHAFRNAAFPLITMAAYLFPRAVAGSVLVEYIFSVPGMGRLTLQSIQQEDWPVVFGVLLLGAVLTLVGMLVSDVLYYLADPRLRTASSSTAA